MDELPTALIQLFDISGRLVPVHTRRSKTGTVEVTLTVQSRPGAYILQVTERGQIRKCLPDAHPEHAGKSRTNL
jgi:hypothetical protein